MRFEVEDDDVSALGRVALHDVGRTVVDPIRERNLDPVSQLVHEDVIAHLERGDHGTARDLERLDHERAEAQHLIDAMNELPPRQREVLHLVFYEEMTLREAAELLDIRFGSASTHYDRGKKSLLERLRMRGVTR